MFANFPVEPVAAKEQRIRLRVGDFEEERLQGPVQLAVLRLRNCKKTFEYFMFLESAMKFFDCSLIIEFSTQFKKSFFFQYLILSLSFTP